MEWFLLILGFSFLIFGIIGCFIPIIPGPPLSFLGILIGSFTDKIDISNEYLLYFALIVTVITVLDFYLPAYTVKKFGSSKSGYYGSIAGILIGIIFLGIIGSLIAPFFGALIGEIISGKSIRNSIKPAFGSFLGIISGIFIKLVVSLFLLYKFVALFIDSL